jgi:uncharacterized protein DUF6688
MLLDRLVIILFCITLLPPLCLAFPVARKHKSLKRFIIAFILSVFFIQLPVYAFFLSGFAAPNWKGACHYRWLDCFHLGKLALTPLVLWACAAFYVIEILKPEKMYRPLVVFGIINGAIVSSICFIFGLVIHTSPDEKYLPFFPFFVAVIYSLVCIRAIRKSKLDFKLYFFTLLGLIPFWAISIFWSIKHYFSLPDQPPPRTCFIVTAALHGHNSVVGPFMKNNCGGVSRTVNHQLLTFWEFEKIWQHRSPQTHKVFRCIYNRIGPVISRRVTSPLAADIIYLLIKPFEFLAAIIVNRYKV